MLPSMRREDLLTPTSYLLPPTSYLLPPTGLRTTARSAPALALNLPRTRQTLPRCWLLAPARLGDLPLVLVLALVLLLGWCAVVR